MLDRILDELHHRVILGWRTSVVGAALAALLYGLHSGSATLTEWAADIAAINSLLSAILSTYGTLAASGVVAILLSRPAPTEKG